MTPLNLSLIFLNTSFKSITTNSSFETPILVFMASISAFSVNESCLIIQIN
jgi:hypothetical protein